MEKTSLLELRDIVKDYIIELKSDEPWGMITRISNSKLFVNAPDRYVIVYGKDFEVCISCILEVYKDANGFLISKNDLINEDKIDCFRIRVES